MGPPKKKTRRGKYEHPNLFSKYHMDLLIGVFYEGYRLGQRNLQPRDFSLAQKDLDDEYHISLVEYAIEKHNKEVEDNGELAFEELTSVKTCDSHSQSCLEYHFFFVARNLSKDELGCYYADVYATYPDEDIHVESFGCLRNANEDGSGSLCEKGKQSHGSFMGISSDSSVILSDRIPTPSLIIGPPKNTEGKTLKDCELELKARRAKYEHLNLFSKYLMKLHIKALYNGYRRIRSNLEDGHYSLGINFTLEDLNDEFNITLVKFAIAKHNRRVEDNAKLGFEELIYIDTIQSPSYTEYYFFFVANNLSKNDLGGYYAKVKATYPGELIHANKICRLRNPNDDGGGSSREKGTQSHESSMAMNSDSIGISDSISTPIQMEDRAGPKKTEDKSMKDRVEEYKKRQNKYDHLHLFTDSEKRSNICYLTYGYRQQKRVKRSLETGIPIIFGEFGIRSAFTLEDLDDEYHIILVKYAIAKHNKKAEDNAKLAFEDLIRIDTCKGVFSFRYYFYFVARKCYGRGLGSYFAEVHTHGPDRDISECRVYCLRSQEKDGNGPSCEKGKQSDESSRGMNSNANEDGRVSSCLKGKQSNESSIGMEINSVEILSDRIPSPILIMSSPRKKTEGKAVNERELEFKARLVKYERLHLFSEYELQLHIRALYNGYGRCPRNLQPRDYGLMINFTLDDLHDKYHISLVKHAIAKHNKKVEANAKLALEELIFVDTCNSLSHLEYHFFFVAHKLSNKHDLGGYYAEVYATYPDEHIHVESFCCLRNGEEDVSGSSTDRRKFKVDRSRSPDGSGSADEFWSLPVDRGSLSIDSGSSSDESSSDESSMGMKSNANEDGSGSTCEKGK